MSTQDWLAARAALGVASRTLPPGHPDIAAARAEFVTARLADHIEQTLAKAPPLSAAQRDRIALALRQGARRAPARQSA